MSSSNNYLTQKLKSVGLTRKDYKVLINKANNSCEICDLPAYQNRTRLCIDHSHETGKFRGFLCQHCNAGLGMFKDNPDLLVKAISYLRERA